MATATTEEKVVEKNLLEAEPRTAGNKNEARRVRRGGKIPAVLYGAGKDALALSLDPRQVSRILHSETGYNTVFELELDGKRTKAMIVDWQYEPIKGALLHIDLKRIAMDQKLKVNVPIVLKGEPAGVKQQGGILEQILREVEIECLPTDIPSHIEADVTELVFGKVLRVADLPHGERLKFLRRRLVLPPASVPVLNGRIDNGFLPCCIGADCPRPSISARAARPRPGTASNSMPGRGPAASTSRDPR